jgi:tol-pal system protein YbgF
VGAEPSRRVRDHCGRRGDCLAAKPMRRLVRRLTPAALLATGACFATRDDVRVLQTDLLEVRTQSAQSDSAIRHRLEEVVATLGTVTDSVRSLGTRLTRMQGDLRGDLYEMGQQLIQIQELTGQSQQRLQELRSEMEQRSQEIATAQTTGAVDTSGATGSPAAGGTATGAPGPNQLFQLSLEQLRRGSAGAARTGFEELLRQYPTSDVAADAQFYIGEAYNAEGNAAAADSAYAIVVSKYPTSARAPTALYKRALALEAAARTSAARAALNQLIQRYPRSDEAALARERLRTMR